jgi:hypothetical protein
MRSPPLAYCEAIATIQDDQVIGWDLPEIVKGIRRVSFLINWLRIVFV